MCRFILLVLAVMAMGLTSARANLIVNPGFETCPSGQASGWQPSTINPLGFPCSPPSHTGVFATHMVGAGSLTQTIAAVLEAVLRSQVLVGWLGWGQIEQPFLRHACKVQLPSPPDSVSLNSSVAFLHAGRVHGHCPPSN